jgi:hypothetical protein
MFRNLSSIISFKTFRAEGKEWRRFGKIFFLIAGGSLLVLAATLEFITWRVGQTMPYDEAAREQMNNPVLLWNDGDSYQAGFKVVRMGQERPDVVVMGQSRMSQFRSGMFHPYSFYNFSRISWSFGVYSELWRRLPADYRPKVVLFSLDFFNLNPRYLSDYADALPQPPRFRWMEHLAAWRDVYNLLYIHPDLIWAGRHDSEGQPSIGLNASYLGDGVRQDGSETVSLPMLKTAGRNPDLFQTIQLNHLPIYYGDAVSSEEMTKFEKFVSLVHARGATLIGVQMPIYGPVMRVIERDPNYGILKDFRDRMANGYFDRQGVIVFDYSKLSPYSDDYRYFIDAFHPTEVACAAAVLKMSSDPRVKAVLPNLDTVSLQRKLDEDRKADRHVNLYRNEF